MVELEKSELRNRLALLEKQADPQRASDLARYHKVQRPYLGLRVPRIAEAAGKMVEELDESQVIQLVDGLWETNIHEARIAVGKILELKKVRNTALIWPRIEKFKEDLDAWAIADHLAKAAFRCLEEHPVLMDRIEQDWLQHENFWVRRAALVYTLYLAKKGRNPERPLKWAAGMVDDREWFIQKAIGWWLRELSKHNPERVKRFLDDYSCSMKPFAVREASKYLTK